MSSSVLTATMYPPGWAPLPLVPPPTKKSERCGGEGRGDTLHTVRVSAPPPPLTAPDCEFTDVSHLSGGGLVGLGEEGKDVLRFQSVLTNSVR